MHSKKGNINKTKNFIQGLRPFSNSLPHGFKKILKKRGYNFTSLVDNWTKIVGRDVSDFCYPIKIKISKDINNGILILNVIHGNELKIEYDKQKILDKINSFFGYNYVKEIKLQITQENTDIKPRGLDLKKNEDKFNKKIDKVKNRNLKDSLEKLVNAYSVKKFK